MRRSTKHATASRFHSRAGRGRGTAQDENPSRCSSSRRENYGHCSLYEGGGVRVVGILAVSQGIEASALHERVAEDDAPRRDQGHSAADPALDCVEKGDGLRAEAALLLLARGGLHAPEHVQGIPLQLLLAPDDVRVSHRGTTPLGRAALRAARWAVRLPLAAARGLPVLRRRPLRLPRGLRPAPRRPAGPLPARDVHLQADVQGQQQHRAYATEGGHTLGDRGPGHHRALAVQRSCSVSSPPHLRQNPGRAPLGDLPSPPPATPVAAPARASFA
mmetsp:Transcript_66570/g.187490  ORF Transcript_66570/g.187490 Transcript_66570/m.187490 type:complete len:275 (-) Transcript_66570:68-892(-)